MEQIAKEFHCSRSVIKNYLRKYGIRKNHQGRHRCNLAFGQKIEKGRVVAHQREAQLLESIKEMHTKEGLSASAIARILTQMGVPTKKRGKTWKTQAIVSILKRHDIYRSHKLTKES